MCLIEEDAVMSMLARTLFFLAKFFLLVAYIMGRAHRVRQRGGSRVPDCPLNHATMHAIYNLLLTNVYNERLTNVSHPTAVVLLVVARHVISYYSHIVHICLSPHTDTIYGYVSVRNTARALILVRIAPPCSH